MCGRMRAFVSFSCLLLLLTAEPIQFVQAGTVYGCYGTIGPGPNPGWSMSAAIGAVNLASNCDDTPSLGPMHIQHHDLRMPAGRVGADMSNPLSNPIHNSQRIMIYSFEYMIRRFCANGLGYWYFDGDGKLCELRIICRSVADWKKTTLPE